jgi:hypothetical protein
MTVTYKDRKSDKNLHGQFMTPDSISQQVIDRSQYRGVIIEPSFGLGSFLYKLEHEYAQHTVIGIECDKPMFDEFSGKSLVYHRSFYKFTADDLPTDSDHITFCGNPPYRTPAYSLSSDDRDYVKYLVTKYKLTGVKEEAVFFIAHMVELIKQRGVSGALELVLPKTIFENPSKGFHHFRKFLATHCPLISLEDVSEDYPDVSQDLVIANFVVNQHITDNEHVTFDFVISDSLVMSDIFKRTYLGSVPCEGIFLSCLNEPVESFTSRLCDIFLKDVPIKQSLMYNGRYHLRALNSETTFDDKLASLQTIVDRVKSKDVSKEHPVSQDGDGDGAKVVDVRMFENPAHYKPIVHRKEIRYYFRHNSLKNLGFVYIVNPNPCPSFYYPGNPTKTSTDYFGYCDYDCNRNCSPGANRTIPTKDVIQNITPTFLRYWKEHTNAPITDIFDYIFHVSKSEWYKTYKQTYQRFYFGLPKEFDKCWNVSMSR